jgi:hypothetical protein
MASVNLIRNIGLGSTATGGQTGLVDEPTAAAFYDELYMTGNWFASHSGDGGQTWTLVNPYTELPPPTPGFCCDQVTVHERSRNVWLWSLQYRRASTGRNIFRLAASTSGKPGPWFWWDFDPGAINSAWSNLWFDYPDVATSNDHVYMTYNMFDQTTPKSKFVQSVVFKMSIDAIVNRNLPYEYYVIDTHGSLRLTRGATSDMYFASHRGGPVRIFRWPDAPGSTMSYFDVTPSAWTGTGTYTSNSPDGSNWLGRTDPRITGAWTVGSEVGFMWTANSRAGRPHPYVKVIAVDVNNQSITSEPEIWNNNVAWAYPAACPNVDGVIGISLFYGGGTAYPTHVVGYFDSGGWVVAGTVASDNGPADNTWGDYLSCETVDPDGVDWVASGYSLQGGNTRDFIQPQYVQFGTAP